MEPVFLELDEVLGFHADQIRDFGGTEGVRDVGLLRSAVEMPRAGFGDQYMHSDVFEMAAAYLFHLAKNHPFVDGNKRTATFVACTFLELNGYGVHAPGDGLVELAVSVAAGRADKGTAAAFFRKYSRRRRSGPMRS